MQKSIFFVLCLFLATSLVNGSSGYFSNLSGIPFVSYFTNQDTPVDKQISQENITVQDEVLNADNPLPVDEFLDIIEQDEDETTSELEKEQITETLKSLKISFADDTLQKVKVLYRNVWHAVNLGVPGSSERLRNADRAESLWERFVNMLARIRDAILEMLGLKEPEIEKDKDKQKVEDNKLVQPLENKENQKSEGIKIIPEPKPPTVKLSEIKPPEIKLPSSVDPTKRVPKDGSTIPKPPATLKPEILTSSKGGLEKVLESANGSNNPSNTQDTLAKPPKKGDPGSLSEREKFTTDGVHKPESKTVTMKPVESSTGTMTVMGGSAAADPEQLAKSLFGQLAAGDTAAKTENADDADASNPKHQPIEDTQSDNFQAGTIQGGNADDADASKPKLSHHSNTGAEQTQPSSVQKGGLIHSSTQAGQNIEEKREGAATVTSGGTATEPKNNEAFTESVERLKTESQQGSKDDATKQRMKQELDNIFLNKKELGPDEAISMTNLLTVMKNNGILVGTDINVYGQKIMDRNTKLKSLMMERFDEATVGKQVNVAATAT